MGARRAKGPVDRRREQKNGYQDSKNDEHTAVLMNFSSAALRAYLDALYVRPTVSKSSHGRGFSLNSACEKPPDLGDRQLTPHSHSI